MSVFRHVSGAAALLAVFSMSAPASAVDLLVPSAGSAVPAAAAWDSASQNADNHRYRRYRDRGIDAGDVIAGAVILGTVAAIASAANRNSRDRDYRYRDRDYRYRSDYPYRDRPYQYRPYRGDSRYSDSRGIDRAVEMCVSAIERDVRVQSVDSVDRTQQGWRVEGSVYDGQGFTCRIGNDGRIEGVDYGQRTWNGAAAGEDRQWDDNAYAAARSARDGGEAVGDQPSYPGGPIEGDDDYGA